MTQPSRPYDGVYTALGTTYSEEIIADGLAQWQRNQCDIWKRVPSHEIVAYVRSYCEAAAREVKKRADVQIARNKRADQTYAAQAEELRARLAMARDELLRVAELAAALYIEADDMLREAEGNTDPSGV